MKARFLMGGFLLALASCDPFAPATPETPTTSQEASIASQATELLPLWKQALAARSIIKVKALTADTLELVQSGLIIDNKAFTDCLSNKLFRNDSLQQLTQIVWSPLVWVAEVNDIETIRASFEYSIAWQDGSSFVHGTAHWTVSKANTPGWELTRWEDDAASRSGMFAFCGGTL